ncbi:MAG: hypothetical protein ACRD3E_16615 [Terriglobales bacterium]
MAEAQDRKPFSIVDFRLSIDDFVELDVESPEKQAAAGARLN